VDKALAHIVLSTLHIFIKFGGHMKSSKDELIKEAEKAEALANERVEEKSSFIKNGRDELLARAKAFREAAAKC
jgi:hypothetical protein